MEIKKVCRKCKEPLGKRNRTGLCMKHYFANYRRIHRPRATPEVENWAICWNKNCGKHFKLKNYQHPKYSLCSECKEIQKELDRENWIISLKIRR